jgi:hypothetical protein
MKKQKKSEEIKQLMFHLRQKKIEIGNVTNEYCEGIAKKLEDQVERVLRIYNYTFSCA